MNVADQAWQLDRQIEETEKKTSALILRVLDRIDVCDGAMSEQDDFLNQTEKLIVLRYQRAILPYVQQRLNTKCI